MVSSAFAWKAGPAPRASRAKIEKAKALSVFMMKIQVQSTLQPKSMSQLNPASSKSVIKEKLWGRDAGMVSSG
jgi:hypothetical protein